MSKKMKILFVITKSNFGGAQKYVYDLATNLPKDSYDIAVITGGSGSLIQKLQGQNIRVIPLSCLMRDVSAGGDLSAFIQLLDIFKNEKPDVVHLNSAKAGGVGALAARMAHVPNIIFTAHGWAFNEERPRMERFAIKLFSWVTVLLSNKTIAVSAAVARDTNHWPLIEGKVSVIRNGISTTNHLSREEARTELFKGLAIPTDGLILGTITELHKNKGLEYAIQSMKTLAAEHNNIYFVIVGDGEEREALEKMITENNLTKRVFLVGYIHNAARLLPAFDMFILPSIKEGLPYVILEAGLEKLPVIASEIGGIPEIIENSITGILIPPRDPKSIADAVALLSSSPALRASIAEKLHQNILENFSFSTMLHDTEILYKTKV
jgi:glycosyltransferase involved in cell wall biosynthesis